MNLIFLLRNVSTFSIQKCHKYNFFDVPNFFFFTYFLISMFIPFIKQNEKGGP